MSLSHATTVEGESRDLAARRVSELAWLRQAKRWLRRRPSRVDPDCLPSVCESARTVRVVEKARALAERSPFSVLRSAFATETRQRPYATTVEGESRDLAARRVSELA